ncbi:hypothetical protein C479_09453 [Halovivax asiaticus JCM 14624]|uniref:Lysine exporter protein LysE/YggA n=1 Tax=Halovivax asiaticus JCM 14624 TaxID=1227490 RepID=M0BJH6_9EURY|nr:hypothetical protein [Halovivax asiaticus]ELZ11026.1 hypothetical protein C479_09453 [Halovivax asiaticus JCM 14624]
MNPAGVFVILFGVAIVLVPGKLLTLSFFGTIDGESLSTGGKLFYRVIGVFFALGGVAVTFGY